MKIQELNEIVEFFRGHQDTDEGKTEYFRIILQAETIRLLSEIRKGLRELGVQVDGASESIIGAVESRLWPLVSLYDLTGEQETEDVEKEQKENQEGDEDDRAG
jgi:hypothetical protein